jgi:hypothetical protein
MSEPSSHVMGDVIRVHAAYILRKSDIVKGSSGPVGEFLKTTTPKLTRMTCVVMPSLFSMPPAANAGLLDGNLYQERLRNTFILLIRESVVTSPAPP